MYVELECNLIYVRFSLFSLAPCNEKKRIFRGLESLCDLLNLFAGRIHNSETIFHNFISQIYERSFCRSLKY